VDEDALTGALGSDISMARVMGFDYQNKFSHWVGEDSRSRSGRTREGARCRWNFSRSRF
jgi:hypothetical protein